MLPPKIKDFVRELIKRTQDGEIKWQYSFVDATVSTSTKEYEVGLRYNFNPILEQGEFSLTYYDSRGDEPFTWHTNALYNDYDLVDSLYQNAQASVVRLPF